ncbi:unnamed protein product [Acanthocheilonema viteae]|uniref:Uncharacterized protein n=1 Tax=Acanthocheilonema viteae TaxID=6277 RepID=A0A498S2B3_ACAVI|nr:unnamed protein product [Acanthocheilonema viteae]
MRFRFFVACMFFWSVVSLCMLLWCASVSPTPTGASSRDDVSAVTLNEPTTFCTFITYNNNTPSSLDINDNEVEECIREIRKADWKEVHIVSDDTNSGMKQFFYIFEEPFGPKNTTCFSKNTTGEIYNITIACVNFTEPSAAFNDTTEYHNWNISSTASYPNYTSTIMVVAFYTSDVIQSRLINEVASETFAGKVDSDSPRWTG